MSSSSGIAERFRNGQQTSEDLKHLFRELGAGNASFVRNVVGPYIKYSHEVDEAALVEFLKNTTDRMAAWEIVSGLSNLQCGREDFRDEILRFAAGVDWDVDDYIRIVAISGLPEVMRAGEKVQNLLKRTIRSDNEIVRDVTVEAAQAFCGVPDREIKRGKGRGDLLARVSAEVRQWLDVETKDSNS